MPDLPQLLPSLPDRTLFRPRPGTHGRPVLLCHLAACLASGPDLELGGARSSPLVSAGPWLAPEPLANRGLFLPEHPVYSIPLSVAGIGTRELAMVYLFSCLGSFGTGPGLFFSAPRLSSDPLFHRLPGSSLNRPIHDRKPNSDTAVREPVFYENPLPAPVSQKITCLCRHQPGTHLRRRDDAPGRPPPFKSRPFPNYPRPAYLQFPHSRLHSIPSGHKGISDASTERHCLAPFLPFLCWYLAWNKFDLLHVNSYVPGNYARLAAWLMGVPVILDYWHGFTRFNRKRRFICRFLERCTDLSLAVSAEVRQHLLQQLDLSPLKSGPL